MPRNQDNYFNKMENRMRLINNNLTKEEGMIDIKQIEKIEILISLIETINLKEETIKGSIKIESLTEMIEEIDLKEIGKTEDKIEKIDGMDKEM